MDTLNLNTDAVSERPEGTSLSNWREGPYNRWAFHHVSDVVPCALVKGAAEPATLASAIDPGIGDMAPDGVESLSQFLEGCDTDSLVILRQGRKLWEWSAPHCDSARPHIVFSISKSITAMLTGILADKGLIDVNQVVSHYLPGTRGSAYEDATVQHVLDMNVALGFTEEYLNPDGDYNRYRNASGWNPVDQTQPIETLEPFFYTLPKAPFEHGTVFNYKSPNTDLLGLLLERVSGVYYADLLSELIWQPMGAAHDGLVTVDPAFLARGAGGVCAHVDDLARFGQLVLDGGRGVIPERWIRDTLGYSDRAAWVMGDFVELLPDGNYRNKWYQIGDDEGCFMALGIHGQWLFVNPRRQVVIAKMSSQPEPVDEQLDVKLLQVFGRLTRELD